MDEAKEPSCCVHGCNVTAEHTCMFASLDIICAAVNVCVSEAAGAAASSNRWEAWDQLPIDGPSV